ncbi:hypothetical protein AYI70_g8914 [Smittium culicis]|uniref:Uncharacterized protein n=1 Tax=Smittium culicis TaxID=133412 RepID=A0A1R1XDQ7_9FUNG|nr:hypothetical protein AYI70_g8914 [Smittium culicis]
MQFDRCEFHFWHRSSIFSTVSASLPLQNEHFVLYSSEMNLLLARLFAVIYALMRTFAISLIPRACSGYASSSPIQLLVSPSPESLGCHFAISSLKEPLFPAYSPADPCIKPSIERLADQIADPCFQCDPFCMAALSSDADSRVNFHNFQLVPDSL